MNINIAGFVISKNHKVSKKIFRDLSDNVTHT
jgi:hypothetical protein